MRVWRVCDCLPEPETVWYDEMMRWASVLSCSAVARWLTGGRVCQSGILGQEAITRRNLLDDSKPLPTLLNQNAPGRDGQRALSSTRLVVEIARPTAPLVQV